MEYDWSTALTTLDYLLSYSHLQRLGLALGIVLLFWLFKNLLANAIIHFFSKLTATAGILSANYLLTAFRQPVANILLTLGLYFACKNYLPPTWDLLLNKFLSSLIVIFAAQGIHSLVKLYGNDTDALDQLFSTQVDKILIPFFSKFIRFLVIALAFVGIASNWGYDVNGFIAGLGLGGLAFALAAKDLLANIFSGIVIIADKPFGIGDWIKTSDIEGTIEDINFRSTKIRTFEQALVTVPNANLINAPIVNFTKRSLRRITFNLEISPDTSSQSLQKCITRIHNALLAHPVIDKQTIFVKFDTLNGQALSIFLYFFTNTIVWEKYLTAKQEINFSILKILEEEGISLAIPQTGAHFTSPLQVVRTDEPDSPQGMKTY